MALGLDFGNGAVTGDGESLLSAFTKINNMFSTTTKLTSGDLQINGVNIGKGNSSNVGSTAVGSGALNSNTSGGAENTSFGFGTLYYNTTGICNTGVGAMALGLSNGDANTAVGWQSLYSNNSGDFNTAVGHMALNKNQGGIRNAAIGFVALEQNIDGNSNVGIGEWALNNNQNGSFNTALGTDALYLLNGLSNSTGVGYNAQVSSSNQVRIGDSNVTAVMSQVGSWSDIRDKADVRDTVLGLDFINSLRAVDYKWDYREDYRTEKPSDLDVNATEEEKEAHKILTDEWLESCKLSNLVHDGTHKRTRYHHGLIAQEVQDVIETTGVDFGGFQDHTINGGDDAMTISYMELITPMIKAIQELTARINVLEGN
jgi:hypothetical protein